MSDNEYKTWLKSIVLNDINTKYSDKTPAPEDPKHYLIEQYAALRRERYETTCYRCGLDMYTASKAVCDSTGNIKAMNTYMWSGCEGIDETIVSRDSVARKAVNIILDKKILNDLRNMGTASCAITAATLVREICEKMEFENNATLVPSSQKGTQYRAANGFEKYDAAAEDYDGSGRLDKLLAEGKIGPGDRIATVSPASQSGFHARTIIAVDRDADGKVIGYTVQGNNSLELSHHSIPDPKDTLNRQEIFYASTSKWADEQIAKECEAMQNMSIEEIQQKIAHEQEKIAENVVDIVQVQEARLAKLGEENKKNPTYQEKYPAAYISEEDYNTKAKMIEYNKILQSIPSLPQIMEDLSEEYRQGLKGLGIYTTQNTSKEQVSQTKKQDAQTIALSQRNTYSR